MHLGKVQHLIQRLRSQLTDKERVQLNEYHRLVFEKLNPYFTNEELEWLKAATREV